MTEKLNRDHIYSSYAFLSKSNIYCLKVGSYRSKCYRCKYKSSCPYSFIIVYYNNEDNCIKCFRFVPERLPGDLLDRDVGLYSTDELYSEYNYFRAGKIYD